MFRNTDVLSWRLYLIALYESCTIRTNDFEFELCLDRLFVEDGLARIVPAVLGVDGAEHQVQAPGIRTRFHVDSENAGNLNGIRIT